MAPNPGRPACCRGSNVRSVSLGWTLAGVVLAGFAAPVAALSLCQGYAIEVAADQRIGDARVKARVHAVSEQEVILMASPGHKIAAAAGMEVWSGTGGVCLATLPGVYHSSLKVRSSGPTIKRLGVGVCAAASEICEWVEVSTTSLDRPNAD